MLFDGLEKLQLDAARAEQGPARGKPVAGVKPASRRARSSRSSSR
jgi:hypothetical protein